MNQQSQTLTENFGVRQRLVLIGILNGIRKSLVESPEAGLSCLDREIESLCVVPAAKSTSAERMRAMRARHAAVVHPIGKSRKRASGAAV